MVGALFDDNRDYGDFIGAIVFLYSLSKAGFCNYCYQICSLHGLRKKLQLFSSKSYKCNKRVFFSKPNTMRGK